MSRALLGAIRAGQHVPGVRRYANQIAAVLNNRVVVREALADLSLAPTEPWYPLFHRARVELLEASPVDGRYERYRTEEMLYWCPLLPRLHDDARRHGYRTVLDVGAGYGTLALYMHFVTGGIVRCIDLHPEVMPEAIRDGFGIDVQASNIETEPIPWTESFDLVVFTEVLEHLNFYPLPTIKKLFDAMNPGGRIYLSTPDAEAWGTGESRFADYRAMPQPDPEAEYIDLHHYIYRMDEVVEILEAGGFVVDHSERAPGRWNLHLNVVAHKPRDI